jgi:hypothetical protein
MKTSLPTISLPSHGFLSRSVAKAMAACALLIGVAAYSASARADDIYWSIGLGSPGVTIGMTNARPLPIFVQPQPQHYYVQPATVYVHPGAIYAQPVPIYVQPRPVYQQGWAVQGRPHGKGPKHDRRHDNRGHGRGPQGYGHGR